MRTLRKCYYLILFSFLSLAFTLPIGDVQETNVEKIESGNFNNFYRLNDSLYRSEQPSKKGMKALETMGIKSILNLRRQKTDEKKLKGLNLHVDRIPLKAATLDFEDVFNALNSIQQAEKPVLIHCWHGSDRTGAIVATYRMVFENWSKEKAIAEFTDKRFGYHKARFPNLLTLLDSMNVPLLKKKLEQERMSQRN